MDGCCSDAKCRATLLQVTRHKYAHNSIRDAMLRSSYSRCNAPLVLLAVHGEAFHVVIL